MSKYVVQDTHIKHAPAGAKKAKVYAPEDDIELTEKEAEALGPSVKPAPKKEEKSASKKDDSKPGSKK